MGVFTSSEPAKSAPFSTPRALTAAAAQVRVGDKAEFEQFKLRRNASSSMWQQEAWEYYDAIGEIKYAFNLVASVISRIRLYPAIVQDMSEAPQPLNRVESVDERLAAAATRALSRLDSAYGGQAGLLRDAALNLSVAGECYLVQIPERPGSGLPESWDIRSVDELVADSKHRLRLVGRRESSITSQNAAATSIVLPDRAFVGRIWRAHPRFSDEADSSLRGLLDLCAELLLLNRTFRATARSRLNAGALYLPDGLAVSSTMGSPDMPYSDESDPNPLLIAEEAQDDFENELIDAMTTPIKDEDSASAVVPLIIRGPAELGDRIKQFKFERSFDPALAQRADRVLERILQGLDVPKDIVTGLANVKYCFREDTEIYTKSGWKKYTELSVGEEVYTLNHETGLGEWQPATAINVFPYDSAVDGPMLRINTASIDATTTRDHRWAVIKTGKKVKAGTERRFTTTESLTSTDRIPLSAPANPALLPAGAHGDWRDEFAELIGWYITEGTISNYKGRGRHTISIGQSSAVNPLKVARIRRTLTALYGPSREYDRMEDRAPRWCEYLSSDKTMVIFHLNAEASAPIFEVVSGPEKNISLDFIHQLSPSQLLLFAESAMEADGSYFGEKKGYSGEGIHPGIFWQKNENILNAVEAALILLGQPITRYYSEKLGFGLRLKKRGTVAPKMRKKNIAEVDYVGSVWCPTTKNSTWLARSNGTIYFTGNSNALQIDETLYKTHIEPLMLLIADALTVVYLRPYLIANGYSPAEVDKVVVWYDPSAIATRNDRAADADLGFDKGAISYDAWRRTHGFTDADAPTPDEVALRMITEKGMISPELTEAVLTAIAPAVLSQVRSAQQAESVAPVPPEVEQIIQAQPAPAAVEAAPAEAAPESAGEPPSVDEFFGPEAGGQQ